MISDAEDADFLNGWIKKARTTIDPRIIQPRLPPAYEKTVLNVTFQCSNKVNNVPLALSSEHSWATLSNRSPA